MKKNRCSYDKLNSVRVILMLWQMLPRHLISYQHIMGELKNYIAFYYRTPLSLGIAWQTLVLLVSLLL